MHDNQLVIDGIATYDELGLILIGSPSIDPAIHKSYTLDIPGGDGLVDLSEFAGDTVYSTREMSFDFLLVSRIANEIEQEKTQLAKRFNGLECDFALSWDPGYTYHGRWDIQEYPNMYDHGTATFKCVAEPYKSKGLQTYRVNAAGGVWVSLPNGRRRVCPKVEVSAPLTMVQFDDEVFYLYPGTYQIHDLWFKSGDNRLFLDTSLDAIGTCSYSELGEHTYEEVRDLHHIFEWYQLNGALQETSSYAGMAVYSYGALQHMSMLALTHPESADATDNVYLQYEWQDL